MPKKKYSEYDYIHLNKKITSKKIFRIVKRLSEQWEISHNEVCYRLIERSAIELDSKPVLYAGLK